MPRAVTFVLACALGACGFGTGGLGGGEQGADDSGSPMDATSEVDAAGGRDAAGGMDARDGMGDALSGPDGGMEGSSTDSSTPCLDGIPMGWSLLLSETAQATCPDGTMPKPAIANPMALAGACTCACSVTAPNCGYGNVPIMAGTSGCTGSSSAPADGSCPNLMGMNYHVLAYHQISALAPQGGSCTWNATKNAAQVSSTAVGLCDPKVDREAVCEGTVPGGFSSCIGATGDTACSAPFVNKTVIYDPMPGLQCGSCGACTVSATCSGTLNFYSDNACGALLAQVVADGSCDMENNNVGAAFNSWKYVAGVNATCSGSPTSAATLMTNNPRTLCCR